MDVSALLRVYLTFDLVSEAGRLACDYLEAVTDSLTGTDEPAFRLKVTSTAYKCKARKIERGGGGGGGRDENNERVTRNLSGGCYRFFQ